MSAHNEVFRNNVYKYQEDIKKDLLRLNNRKKKFNVLTLKLKQLRFELLILEITTGLVLLSGLTAILTGFSKGLPLIVIIITVIAFIILKITRYKEINPDLSLPQFMKYKLYENSVNDEYFSLLEKKSNRLNHYLKPQKGFTDTNLL